MYIWCAGRSTTSRCSQYARKILLACWPACLHTHKHLRTRAHTQIHFVANSTVPYMYVCTLKHKYHTGAFCSIQVLRALGRISVRVFSTHSPPPNCSRRTTMRPLEFCPRLNSLSPSSIVTTTNQLQETPAGNPCRKTPRAENSSMLHTEEVLTQPRLLQHGGNAKHTHDRLPMDSLTRLFGSPEHGRRASNATMSVCPGSPFSGHFTVMVFPATRARNSSPGETPSGITTCFSGMSLSWCRRALLKFSPPCDSSPKFSPLRTP